MLRTGEVNRVRSGPVRALRRAGDRQRRARDAGPRKAELAPVRSIKRHVENGAGAIAALLDQPHDVVLRQRPVDAHPPFGTPARIREVSMPEARILDGNIVNDPPLLMRAAVSDVFESQQHLLSDVLRETDALIDPGGIRSSAALP